MKDEYPVTDENLVKGEIRSLKDENPVRGEIRSSKDENQSKIR